jgi:hypothetical protein
LQISFDERGRMWVVQYRQYPNPAGLKMVSRDNFWRAVYDKVPPPPPNHVRGLDKITIHEDTDGDGKYDKHKTFVDGLNIATSMRDWITTAVFCAESALSALLSRRQSRRRSGRSARCACSKDSASKTRTRSPTACAGVRMDGFTARRQHHHWQHYSPGRRWSGRETRISSANASGDIIPRPNVLKFSPKAAATRLVSRWIRKAAFSGHNGGNTRGFYYPQGAYEQKGFEKHGRSPILTRSVISNKWPSRCGSLHAHIPHLRRRRIARRVRGKLFGCEPLQGRVVMS